MQVTVISIIIGALGKVAKGLIKGQEDLEIINAEIGQNTEKSFGDLMTLVSQIPVKDHQLTLT